MKASIDETGTLFVTAETPLESYALKTWFSGYNRPAGEQTSALSVETTVVVSDPSSGYLDRCNKNLADQHMPYPRTCAECGLGPCKRKELF